jgi:transcriptional regulator with XRE-family HTH domain
MTSKETPRLIELGSLMRELRKSAGLTQLEVATAMGRAISHPSRWEGGKLFITEEELGEFLRLVGAGADRTLRAMRLHRDAADPDWMIPGIPRPLAVLREYEDRANRATSVQPDLVPGWLQIPQYAHEVLSSSGNTPQQVNDWTELRMARRDSILASDVRIEAIIGEHALRYPACSREVAVKQLHDLAETSKLPHVTVRILESGFGYHPMRNGAFVLLEFEEGKPVVHLEQFRSSTTLTDSRAVKDYQDAAETLRRASMSPAASTKLIEVLANKLESTT